MATVALTFAVLGSGGSAADLGYVFAAGVIPQVLFMLGGGVLADRLGRRKVMLGADAARLSAQGILAAGLLADGAANLGDRGAVGRARYRRGILYPGARRADAGDHAA